MLTPFATGYVDLQSPAGAGIAGVIYDYDGNIYACDEGRMLSEMGDETFCIGSVSQEYSEVFAGDKLRTIIESSIVETHPHCTDCAYRIWCGADPARHYATQGDMVGHKALSEFCNKHQMLFDFLVTLLETCDKETKDILYSWIGGEPLEPKEDRV
jgi:radical SAM protein with 4Fe4S-binding SPASM domain